MLYHTQRVEASSDERLAGAEDESFRVREHHRR